jgi:hypothetical protein
MSKIASMSSDSDEIDDNDGDQRFPSDPLDLVDLKVKHSATKESENAKISSIVEEFCRFSS